LTLPQDDVQSFSAGNHLAFSSSRWRVDFTTMSDTQHISDLHWEANRHHIEKLWMTENLTIHDVITQMRERFSFIATYVTPAAKESYIN
jgi:3-oxoacyl-ACP reductase-like protein